MSTNDLYQKLEQSALSHLRAYESPNPFDLNEAFKYRSDDCFQRAPLRIATRDLTPFHLSRTIYSGIYLLESVIDKVRFEMLDQSVDVRKRIVTQSFRVVFDLKGFGDEHS